MAAELLGRHHVDRADRFLEEEENFDGQLQEGQGFADSELEEDKWPTVLEAEDSEFKGKIESASSIEELISVIEKEPTIYCNKVIYHGTEIATRISAAADFLRTNIDQVILSTISQKVDNKQAEFSRIFSLIPFENNLGIKEKARELMMQEMEQYFENKKDDFTIHLISSAKDLEQLCQVLNHFKVIRQGEKIYNKEDLVRQIGDAGQVLLNNANIGIFDSLSIEQVEKQIKSLISGVPSDSGIYDKVFRLLLDAVKNKFFERHKKKRP